MRDQIHRLLQDEGRSLSYTELASKLLRAEGLGEAVSRAILEPLLQNNPNFSQDAEGNWRAAEPYLEARFLPEVTFAVVDIETTGGRPPSTASPNWPPSRCTAARCGRSSTPWLTRAGRFPGTWSG